ncbi:class I SAM-dependent methyltransferase [candidate division KSB1 bacterium]
MRNVQGTLCFDREVLDIFLNAPYDVAADFQGPQNVAMKGGRGKDHPRYGRFVYSFAKYYKPGHIVEVGTYAGGTSVGWARALAETGSGVLTCIDNDTYSHGTYPDITRVNIGKTGLSSDRYTLLSGDSKTLIPELALKYNRRIDIYLVDGDHTYEGAMADINNGIPMMKPGGFILVHDLDTNRKMNEETAEHPHPVYEAFMETAEKYSFQWCILTFIRKHLGVIKIR